MDEREEVDERDEERILPNIHHNDDLSFQDLIQVFSASGRNNMTPQTEPISATQRSPMLEHKAVLSQQDLRYQQLSAKLHCLYGVPIQSVHRTSRQRYALRSDTMPIHPYARSRVYDMRQHTDASSWGPFLSDGTHAVDWEKLEALMLILHHNVRLFSENHDVSNSLFAIPNWDVPFAATAPYSYVSRETSIPMEPTLPLELQDPYNITGTWMRVVCFLDYTELFDFNFMGNPPPPTQPRPALDTEEAIRLITMKLAVTKIESPGYDDGKKLPVAYFNGSSSSVRPSWDPNANSKIRGMFVHFISIRRES